MDPLLEHDVAGDRLVDVAAQRTWHAGRGGADLDHLDLAVGRGMRTEEAAIGKAEADPADRRLLAQQRQEQELALDLVVGLDRALEEDRAHDLGRARKQREGRGQLAADGGARCASSCDTICSTLRAGGPLPDEMHEGRRRQHRDAAAAP